MDAASNEGSKRIVGRPWQKGQSGNPSGLSKDIAAEVAEGRRLALAHAPAAVARHAELLDHEDPRVAQASACAILDRAGAAPRSYEGERREIVHVVDVERLRAKIEAWHASLAAPPIEIVALPPDKGGAPNSACEPCPRFLGSPRVTGSHAPTATLAHRSHPVRTFTSSPTAGSATAATEPTAYRLR
jgi:hypothetical protein